MNEIKIKCPTCGKILRLQDGSTINSATFTCPVCKEKHKVCECQRLVDQPKPQTASSEETQYGMSSSYQYNGDETRIGTAQQISIGSLVDNFGRTYKLSLGINTIGRKANSSTSTVQINTEDHYMSRNHAIIEVRKSGDQIIHILKNGANKNPSYLNSSLIGTTDQFVLNNGDRIRMGKTELTFKK